jgi:hypothetical protein
MLGIFTELFKLPLAAFVYSMEMVVTMMRGLQKMADQGIDTMASGVAQTLGQPPGSETAASPGQAPGSPGDPQSDVTHSAINDAISDSAQTPQKEEKNMADNDLSNDRVKVVEYYILSIVPDNEHVLPGFPKVKVFKDNMTGEDFAAWVIADYFQEHPGAVRPENKKYVRVCYEVICTFEAEDANYDKEQVQVLREIARRIGPAVIPAPPVET